MELIENKLNSNNPLVVSQVLSSVVKNILNKDKVSIENAPELKFLNDKCVNDDPLISEVACHGILLLIEKDILEVDNVLQEFMTRISTVRCFSGLSHLLGRLLYLELVTNLTKNKPVCQYNIRFPQHPFVALLHEHGDSWRAILNEIELFYKIEDVRVKSYNDLLFKPLFLYSICNPGEQGLNFFKAKLWKFLIESSESFEVIEDLLGWMPLESKCNINLISDFICDAINEFEDEDIQDVLNLFQISVLHQLLLVKGNPMKTLDSMNENLQSCSLYVLSKSIYVCSPLYLEQLLNFCRRLISNQKCDIFALNTLKSSLIHLIANSSLLNEKSLQIAKQIYAHIENNRIKTAHNKEFFKTYENIFKSNSELYLAIKLDQISDHLTEKNLEDFLKLLSNSPQFFIKSIIHYLRGLFLQNLPRFFEHSLLGILIKNCETYAETSPETLSIILYKLSKTTDPKLHKLLINSLPKMLVLKENYQKVVATALALSKGPEKLQNLSALLLLEIWKIEDRTYTNLEHVLLTECNKNGEILEFYTTRAYILKEICEINPEKYGKEIVVHLSNIVNKHSDENGALACSLAIDGIRALCRAEIIDAMTTWANLAPKFNNDIRPPIVKSLCKLIQEIPLLPYSDAYPDLVNEVNAKLWHYIVLTMDEDIMPIALNALTMFNIEQISLNMPDDYLEIDVIESRKEKANKIPFMVPGSTWINFMRQVPQKALKTVVDFLIKMVSIEIDNYLKYVYQVKENSEPIHLSNLPVHSIVRAIAYHLKHWLSKWKDPKQENIYIECLRIFSQVYSKPLPPFNWHFLLELIGDPTVRNYCIDIASHQVMLSGSARQIMENLVDGCTVSKNGNDIMAIYKNLKFLANSLQPITLKPFLEKSLDVALDGDQQLLRFIVDSVRGVLGDKNIQDINKSTIAEVLIEKLYVKDVDSEDFRIFLECVEVFPVKYVEKIAHSSKCVKVSQSWFEKALAIRCRIARTSMDYLDDVLDVVCGNNIDGANELTFKYVLPVFMAQVENSECALWLLELIGKIQAKVAHQAEEKVLVYLFDVFMLAVVVFSGHFMFLDDKSKIMSEELGGLFPQAFAHLMTVDHWSVCVNQALEWFYYVNSNDYIPGKYRQIFGLTLRALRHQSEFTKNLKWMKYYNCRT